MISFPSIFLSMACISLSMRLGEIPPEIQRAVQLAKDLGKATVSNDLDMVLSCTPPEVIKIMGGKDAFLSQLKQLFQKLKEDGFIILDYQVQQPGQVVRREDRIFCFIPTKIVMQTPKGKIKQETFLLGVSQDRGKSWVFADAAGLNNPDAKKMLFPDLPSELIIPPVKPLVVIE